MGYEMEDLLPVAGRLARKYTSGESSSVTYETAREMMRAVIYCIHEFENGAGERQIKTADQIDIQLAYNQGYQLVLDKVYEAKKVYELLIEDFCDYGVRNYRETVCNGFPAFFIHYDARFAPQDHILTLDYPAIKSFRDKTGIDLIYDYLNEIRNEKLFLELYPASAIEKLLSRVQNDYEELYFDNICYQVMLQSIGCMVADCSLERLYIPAEEYRTIETYFEGDAKEEITKKTAWMISQLLNYAKVQWTVPEQLASAYSARIWTGMQTGEWQHIFV